MAAKILKFNILQYGFVCYIFVRLLKGLIYLTDQINMSKSIQIKNQIPLQKKDKRAWQLNRKQFIAAVLLGGAATQLPVSCAARNYNTEQTLLSDEKLQILQSVQEILFPSSDIGPGAKEINAATYLVWVLSDPQKDLEEIEYIINGIGWVDETAEENFSKKYMGLTHSEKEKLIADISKISWGESWLSVILTFIFEALLSDPRYGSNPDQIGWKWLKHNPGQPRPTKTLLYPEIITTIREL